MITTSDLNIAQSEIRRIRRRYSSRANAPYVWRDYEHDIECLVTKLFPYASLPGIRLYDPFNLNDGDFGVELDNLLHFQKEGSDWLVEIEAKMQPIQVSGNKWLGSYDSGRKDCRKQLDSHTKALWHYLEPLQRGTDLQNLSLVVTPGSKREQPTTTYLEGYKNSRQVLLSIEALPDYLNEFFSLDDPESPTQVIRVAQSPFLETLRLCLPIPHLGHPELNSATRYVDRCRRDLDATLFKEFTPTKVRWAINGTAGMGKSVLLAYAGAVFSSGFQLDLFGGQPFSVDADDFLSNLGYDRKKNPGPIGIIANTRKQLAVLKEWFTWFAGKLQKHDDAGRVRITKPTFLLAREIELVDFRKTHWSAILVDEAHDLSPPCQNILARTHEEGNYYLLVAYDRHQKLRLNNSRTKVIEGLEFKGKYRRLKRIYRNPAPIYIASLALMFRWFASKGPVVQPSEKELIDGFGLSSNSLPGNGISVSLKSDAHPANSWSHTVSRFPNVTTLYDYLVQEKLEPEQVLWVRFSEEESDFDYERINRRFTYHNCRTREAYKISDKYIKGQDFHIVVIEGFPKFMDEYTSDEREQKMWQFRRELYLCESRATSFLYFVCCAPETPEIQAINSELNALIEATSQPVKQDTRGTNEWRFRISVSTKDKRRLDVFEDAGIISAEPTELEEDLNELEVSKEEEQKPSSNPKETPAADQTLSPSKPTPNQPRRPQVTKVVGELRLPELSKLFDISEDDLSGCLLDLGIPHTSEDPVSIPQIRKVADRLGKPIEVEIAEATIKPISIKPKPIEAPQEKTTQKLIPLSLEQPIIVTDLAKKMNLQDFLLMASLIQIEVFVAPNQAIEFEDAAKVAKMHGYDLKSPTKKRKKPAQTATWVSSMDNRPHTVSELAELLQVNWQQVRDDCLLNKKYTGLSTLVEMEVIEKLVQKHGGVVEISEDSPEE